MTHGIVFILDYETWDTIFVSNLKLDFEVMNLGTADSAKPKDYKSEHAVGYVMVAVLSIM